MRDITEQVCAPSTLDVDQHEETHLAPPPYTHALCGKPRGDKPLRATAEPTRAVCIDLARNR